MTIVRHLRLAESGHDGDELLSDLFADERAAETILADKADDDRIIDECIGLPIGELGRRLNLKRVFQRRQDDIPFELDIFRETTTPVLDCQP